MHGGADVDHPTILGELYPHQLDLDQVYEEHHSGLFPHLDTALNLPKCYFTSETVFSVSQTFSFIVTHLQSKTINKTLVLLVELDLMSRIQGTFMDTIPTQWWGHKQSELMKYYKVFSSVFFLSHFIHI